MTNSDEKIILDQQTFKALAVDSRVKILKELSKRQKTQSELAEAMGLSVATVKEHLDKMREANLIKIKDADRKWKYYFLTEKGKCVLFPERKKIWVILTSLIFMVVFSGFVSFQEMDPFANLAPAPMMAKSAFMAADVTESGELKIASYDVNENFESTDDSVMLRSNDVPQDFGYGGMALMAEPEYSENGFDYTILRTISYVLIGMLSLLFTYYFGSYNTRKSNF